MRDFRRNSMLASTIWLFAKTSILMAALAFVIRRVKPGTGTGPTAMY